MRSLLRGRDGFVVGAAVLGTAFSLLGVAYATGWGWIVALIMVPALIVRMFWTSMPGWFLLAWVAVPNFVGDVAAVTQTGYLVVMTALAVVAAGRGGRADVAAMALCTVSPFGLWLLETDSWSRGIGAWLWSGGMLISWVFGHLVGSQRVLIEELERTRTRLAETAVAEDRQRVARDLHDLVGHSFSVVLLHLSGARMHLDSSPQEAEAALRQAEAVGRRGMDELREALALMRHGAPALTPLRQRDLDELLARCRDAGMRVDVRVTGDLETLSAAPRIIMHNVLREGLTNAVMHASAPEASVGIDVDPDGVTIRIENPILPRPAARTGPAAPAAGQDGGMGLAGLEHRVAALDGTFDARPDHERWVVEARLPRHLTGAVG